MYERDRLSVAYVQKISPLRNILGIAAYPRTRARRRDEGDRWNGSPGSPPVPRSPASIYRGSNSPPTRSSLSEFYRHGRAPDAGATLSRCAPGWVGRLALLYSTLSASCSTACPAYVMQFASQIHISNYPTR